MEEKSEVESLKDALYSRKRAAQPMQDVRAPLTREDEHVPLGWEGTTPTLRKPVLAETSSKSGMSLATKFLIGSGVFFVLAVGGAALFFLSGNNYISSQNIDLQIIAPALVDGGSPANLTFLLTNRNSAELQLADLVVDYPDGTRDPKDPQKALTHERMSIGTIAPGRQIKLTAGAMFYGSEGASETIKATLEYSVQGSNAVFTKEGDTTITVGTSPVSVRVDAPTETIAGQPFAITLTVASNAQEPVEDVMVQAQYPFGYNVQSATPRAAAGSTVWRLGTMAPGTTQTIQIIGLIDGQDGDARVFRFLAGSTKDPTASKVEVPFLSVPATLTIHRPFITGDIAVDGQTGDKISAAAGKNLQGAIHWQNNLSEEVRDVQIKLKFSGPVLDRSTISAGSGFYQSSDNTVTWTSSQDPSLAVVAPGGTGTLQFSFATLPPGTGGVVYQNPVVDLNLTVSAVRPGQTGVPETVTSAAHKQITLASATTLTAQALHFTGMFSNSGPMPPRADMPTTYTIVWTVKNSSNAVANAGVSTVLPPYVQFIQGQSGVTYDSGSRAVTWSLGDVSAGVGYTTAARQAAFQVSLNASGSQVGFTPMLTGASALQGTDRFAQTTVSASAEAPTTKLTEAGFAAGMDTVAPKQ